ncbi:MAG: sodium-dependent transporter, partial [Bacteroidetes bacterium]|nr:sodium-dependent transporter [Bacteroidota bacterium]
MSTRSGFSSRLGFVAAAAGSAVGLGNIWKFPYETGENGGAAFLFIYLLCTFLIGFPVMVGEIALGRKAQSNPFG